MWLFVCVCVQFFFLERKSAVGERGVGRTKVNRLGNCESLTQRVCNSFVDPVKDPFLNKFYLAEECLCSAETKQNQH